MKPLNQMTKAELEAEANKLLYGSVEEPYRLEGTQYRLPKKVFSGHTCADCGKPRSYSSGIRCQACYKKMTGKKHRLPIDGETYLRFLDGAGGAVQDGVRIAVVRDTSE